MNALRIAIPDDYQDCVRGLSCFSRLAGHDVTVFHDTMRDVDALAARFQDFDAIVLTRPRPTASMWRHRARPSSATVMQ